MKRKVPWHKKLGFFSILVLAAMLPLTTYVFLTRDFDLRTYGLGGEFASRTAKEKEGTIVFDKESSQDTSIPVVAEFYNDSDEAVVQLGYSLTLDTKYTNLDLKQTESSIGTPDNILQKGQYTTYAWKNILETCSEYPCEASIRPSDSLSTEVFLTPQENTSNLPNGEAYIYSTFSNVVTTTDLSVPGTLAQLPTTGETGYSSKTTVALAETGENQSPVCDTLLIDGPMNSKTILKGHKIPFVARGKDSDDGIVKAEAQIIRSETGSVVKDFTWTTQSQKEVILKSGVSDPDFSYTFENEETYELSVKFYDSEGKTGSCSKNSGIVIRVVDTNNPPKFETSPDPIKTASTPLDLGQGYSYQAKAVDDDNDTINYRIVARPDWLSFSSGKNTVGTFEGIFNGTPLSEEHSGTHPVILSVSDGYEGHISSQIWVLRVNSKENDIPILKIESPSNIALTNSQNITISWKASDKNDIEKFNIYYTESPLDESKWNLIKEGLKGTETSYTWQTPGSAKGNFFVIVEAVDKSSDHLEGVGISEVFSIGTGKVPDKDSWGGDLLQEIPEILNVSPSEDSEITDLKPIISADLRASKGANIENDSVIVKLNDKPITDQAEISTDDKGLGSVVVTLDKELSKGSNKVSIEFKDSAGQKAEKTWTFTVKDAVNIGPDQDPKTISLFGWDIKLDRTTILITLVIVSTVVVLALLPWVLYFSQEKNEEGEMSKNQYDPYSPQYDSTQNFNENTEESQSTYENTSLTDSSPYMEVEEEKNVSTDPNPEPQDNEDSGIPASNDMYNSSQQDTFSQQSEYEVDNNQQSMQVENPQEKQETQPQAYTSSNAYEMENNVSSPENQMSGQAFQNIQEQFPSSQTENAPPEQPQPQVEDSNPNPVQTTPPME